MIYLLLTILLNAVLFVCFKLYPKYNIDTLQAIVVNYITCVVTGSIFIGHFPISAKSVSYSWFPFAVFMGFLFISIFNFIGYSTRRFGITTTSVANKLSLVIPVIFSVILYNEKLTVVNIIGILLAFPAVYFSTRVQEDKHATNIVMPALLFLASGMLDALMKYAEHTYLENRQVQAIFPIHIFSTAAILGITLVGVQVALGKTKLQWRNVIAGIVLGIPNFFSIYYLIRLLNSDWLESSAAIPVNNIGIVVASALVAILFFKEPFTKWRAVGIALSILAIILIAL